MSPSSAGYACYGVSPAGTFKILTIIGNPRNADYPSRTGPGNSGLLLPSGGLRHALLLGEYGNFAIFASALGLHRAMPLELRAFLHRKNWRRNVPAHLRRRADFDPLARDDITADLA